MYHSDKFVIYCFIVIILEHIKVLLQTADFWQIA